MRRFCSIILILSLLTLGLLSGCQGRYGNSAAKNPLNQETEGKPPLKVAATLFPYYDFIRQIAGDQIDLTLVVPAGMDSHSFEPTPADMRKLQEADVLICNGGEMEHWLSQVLDTLDTSRMTVVCMMDYVDTVEEELVEGMEEFTAQGKPDSHTDHVDHDENELEYDEHIWTSPVNAVKLVEAISDVLQGEDPANALLYEERTRSYIRSLEELNQDFKRVMEKRKRNLIVIGDKFPFRYLAEEYQLEYRAAFSGCSTDTEPSAKTIAYLIDKVKEEQIPVIYYLELSSSRVAEIIVGETEAVALLLHSCHSVTRREFEQGITYLELMKQNAEHLRRGLTQ